MSLLSRYAWTGILFLLLHGFALTTLAQSKVQGTTLIGDSVYLEVTNEFGTTLPCTASDLREGIENLKTPVVIANCYFGGFLGDSKKYYFKIRFKTNKSLFLGLRLGDLNAITQTQMKGETNLLGTWINSNFGFYHIKGEKSGDELFVKGFGPNPDTVKVPFCAKDEKSISVCLSIFEIPSGFEKTPDRFKNFPAKEQFIMRLAEKKPITQ